MPGEVNRFVESVAEAFALCGPVYEFGFQSPRGTSGVIDPCGDFPATGHLGCSLEEGAEIDRLDDLVRLPYADASVRTVLCVHALEHAFNPHRAVEELIRILAPGGLLLVCASCDGRTLPETDGYWRPTPLAIQRLLAGLEASLVVWLGAEPRPHSVFGIGCKGPINADLVPSARRFLTGFQERLERAAADRPRSGWFKRLMVGRQAAGVPPEHEPAFYQAHYSVHLPVDERFKHELLGDVLPHTKLGTRLDLSQ